METWARATALSIFFARLVSCHPIGKGDFIFLGSKITVHGDCSHEIKTFASWKESCNKPIHHIKKHRDHFAIKGLYSQISGFSSSSVWM